MMIEQSLLLFREVKVRREIEEEPGEKGVILEIDLAAANSGH